MGKPYIWQFSCGDKKGYFLNQSFVLTFMIGTESVQKAKNNQFMPLFNTTESYIFLEKRVGGIEPPSLAWKAKVLPLNYTRNKLYADCE